MVSLLLVYVCKCVSLLCFCYFHRTLGEMVGNLRKGLDKGQSQKHFVAATALSLFMAHYLTPERKAEMQARRVKVSSQSLLMR